MTIPSQGPDLHGAVAVFIDAIATVVAQKVLQEHRELQVASNSSLAPPSSEAGARPVEPSRT